MSEHGDVPEWLPEERPPAERPPVERPAPGDPGPPRMFLGISDAGGGPLPRSPRTTPPPGPSHLPAPVPARDASSGPPAASPRHGHRAGGAHQPQSPPVRRRRGPLIGTLAGALGLTLLAGLGVHALTSGDGCRNGAPVVLTVAAAPGVAPVVTAAAGRLNDARRKIGSRCVRAEVRSTDPVAVATLLSGSGVAGATRRPDVWIPDSSLWLAQAQGGSGQGGSGQGGSGRAATAGPVRRGSLASSPLVVAVPRTLALRLRSLGTRPSWSELIRAASGTAGPAGGPSLPKDLVKLQVPDPNRTAPGMAALVLADQLRSGDEADGTTSFAGVVRALREGVTPSVNAGFASFRRDRQGRYPVALAPEQAIFEYNARGPAEPAVALYPSEGTLTMDHPILFLGADAVQDRASRLFEAALGAKDTLDDLRELGFRAPDGTAPGTFGAKTGLDPRAPRTLPAPAPAAVRATMQAWARLSLSIRMLSIIDVSGSMDDRIAPDVTRLQSTVRTAQQGLALLPDDSELGQWVFSTNLQGPQDWRELVSVGPLGERVGSATRRQLMLSAFAQIRAKKNGDTGLYDTILSAYRRMKRSYKPEFVNSILLWTDGRNDDPGGPSLDATLDALRREVDPTRPVLVFMYGFGQGVDAGALRRIAQATRGDVVIAETPEEVRENFLQAVARRVCAPGC